MANYDFTTLNDKDFEEFVKDVLNARFGFELQHFKRGRDKGIDLRFSSPTNDNSLVVQAKHYANSGFPQLRHVLVNSEVPKIRSLSPDRYILVTSLSLSAAQKDDLRKALNPFIRTANDIIGREDLNGYLLGLDAVERKHYKLWLSSTVVLETVLNNAVEGRSRYLLQKIQTRLPFYVATNRLSDANAILDEQKILVITGQPGIGKTTLAEIIVFDRAKRGVQIRAVENIREAEDGISFDSKANQLFYIDDFLGSNYLELVREGTRENQFANFVDRIRHSPNKYLLLTTRTVFLAQALEQFERINRARVGEDRFELQLRDYSDLEKAKILYNHLYFNHTSEEQRKEIIADRFYYTVVKHKNYTPRLIELFTQNERVRNLSGKDFRSFVVDSLENPSETWKQSFENQIGYCERCLLFTMISFPGTVEESLLSSAYSSRLAFERAEHNQSDRPTQFRDSVKSLQDGFIRVVSEGLDNPIRRYSFINPSVGDFLISRLINNFEERLSLVKSIRFVSQLPRFRPGTSIIPFDPQLQEIVLDKIRANELKGLPLPNDSEGGNAARLEILTILRHYCDGVQSDSFMLSLLAGLSLADDLGDILDTVEYVGKNRRRLAMSFAFTKNNFLQIFEIAVQTLEDDDVAYRIPHLFDLFEENYRWYIMSPWGKLHMSSLIRRICETKYQDTIAEQEDEIVDMDDVEFRYDELHAMHTRLEETLFPLSLDPSGVSAPVMDKDFWEEKVEENYAEYMKRNAEPEESGIASSNSTVLGMTDVELIDDLFADLVELEQ